MKTFILVGYGDQDGYDRTPQTVKNNAHDYDAYLRANGATMGVAESPVQVRNHGSATTEVTEGPFMSSALPVAGFSVLEAESLEEAIEQAAQTPCAVAYGVVEVWPLNSQG